MDIKDLENLGAIAILAMVAWFGLQMLSEHLQESRKLREREIENDRVSNAIESDLFRQRNEQAHQYETQALKALQEISKALGWIAQALKSGLHKDQ